MEIKKEGRMFDYIAFLHFEEKRIRCCDEWETIGGVIKNVVGNQIFGSGRILGIILCKVNLAGRKWKYSMMKSQNLNNL